MKRFLLSAGGILALAAAYLALWPVPIEPVSWDAQMSEGYVGDFAPNTRLADMERLPIGETYGPEDVAILGSDPQSYRVFVSGHKGEIIEIDPRRQTEPRVVANTGGVPLGIEFASDQDLIIADAYKGLLSLDVNTGALTTLTDRVDGTPIRYADDVDIGPDGVMYFSDASTKFGAEASGGTMAGSLLEIMEMGRTGRVLSYDPRDGKTRMVADNFAFSNGVAMGPEGQSILVNETGTYSVIRIYVSGPRKGERETIASNLPGFPDNINPAPILADGRASYYVGLISRRADFLDQNAGKPAMRKLALRLPASLRPKAVDYTHIVRMTADGEIIETYQDPSGAYTQATGAVMAPDGRLYVSSLAATSLARKSNP